MQYIKKTIAIAAICNNAKRVPKKVLIHTETLINEKSGRYTDLVLLLIFSALHEKNNSLTDFLDKFLLATFCWF